MKVFIVFSLVLSMMAIPSKRKTSMAEVKENLLYDKAEVSNIQWKEFEQHLIAKGESLTEYHRTDIWTNETYRKLYYFHPAFHKYPVVGVSLKGAKAFCEWRNQFEYDFEGTFRLPTTQEFQEAFSEGEASLKWQKKKERFTRKNGYAYNLRKEKMNAVLPVESLISNTFGMYHLQGNVAEITLDNSGAKVVGYSWNDPKEKVFEQSCVFAGICSADGTH